MACLPLPHSASLLCFSNVVAPTIAPKKCSHKSTVKEVEVGKDRGTDMEGRDQQVRQGGGFKTDFIEIFSA